MNSPLCMQRALIRDTPNYCQQTSALQPPMANYRHWFATLAAQALAQVPAPQPDSSSCRKFAQEFYDWYLPFSQKKTQQPAAYLALRRPREVFSPELLKALRIDAEASVRAKGEFVGLDFDPFFGSQDLGKLNYLVE